MRRRSRTIATASAAAGVALVAVLGIANWPQLRERYYLRRLESPDERVRRGAAGALLVSGSPHARARAIEVLLDVQNLDLPTTGTGDR